jgi:hypothetical protein
MSDLLDLITNNENLLIIQKSLKMMDLFYKNIGVNNEDSKAVDKLLEIMENSQNVFTNTEIISGHKLATNGPSDPELFHEPCLELLKKEPHDKYPTILPGKGRLFHYMDETNRVLKYLKCETCKKVFKLSPVEKI